MHHPIMRNVLRAMAATILAVSSNAAALAPLILYNDTTPGLTPGWCGLKPAGTDSIKEITTDSAYEGTKCLDFQYSLTGTGEIYGFCAIKINNLKGVDMSGYDSLRFAYKQNNVNPTPQVDFEFCDNTMPGDAIHLTIPKAPAWHLYAVPLSHWKTNGFSLELKCVEAFYLYVGSVGTGDIFLDDVSLVSAGSADVRNQVAATGSAGRSMVARVNNGTINFATSHVGTVTVFDLVGNRLATLRAENAPAGLSWTAKSTGAYLVRFEGTGMVETQRILVR